MAGVFALDFAGDFAGVFPRCYFEAVLSGDFDFLAVDLPGVFNSLAGVLAAEAFCFSGGDGGAKILEEEPILEGDF